MALGVFCAAARAGEIHDAAAAGDAEKVKALLAKDPTLISAKDDYGRTPLYKAARHGKIEVAKILLAAKADPNAKADHDWTPLHAAIFADNPKYLEQLAATNELSNITVVAKGNLPMVQLLLDNGADPNYGGGLTPLWIATECGNSPIVELLLSRGADVNRKVDGRTPLHDATYLKSDEGVRIMKLLIAKGADINAVAENGDTPQRIAKRYQNKKAIAVLLRAQSRNDPASFSPWWIVLLVAVGVGSILLIWKFDPQKRSRARE